MTVAEEKKCAEGGHTIGVAARLARPNILKLLPYRCARDDYSSGVLLDANENAVGPTSLPTNSIKSNDNHLVLERYPCPYQLELKSLYGKYRANQNHEVAPGSEDILPENIFCGVGSDEAIDLLMRIFCTPGKDHIMTTPPTYGMYKVCANINDVGIQNVPLTPEFDLQVDEMLNAITETTKLIFICSPGNPTAKAIPLSDVERIASQTTTSQIVVVDEAYVDFVQPHQSATSLLSKYPNVVVLQTLSKAFGLAGIRCGFALGSPDVIQLMNNCKAPYNVNKLTAEVAINAMKNVKTLETNIKILLEQRARVIQKLGEFDFVTRVYPSDANFILFRVKQNAQAVYKTMADRGVVVRFRGNELHCDGCIRVTVGTEEENSIFFEKLVSIYNELAK